MKKNRLNIVFGNADSFKTIFLLNKVSKLEDKKVAFITLDNEADNVDKKFHCITNGVSVDSVKYNNETFKPINLKIPENFYVIDWIRSFESLTENIERLSNGEEQPKPDYIFVDNLNLVDIEFDNYDDKLKKIFNTLDKLAKKYEITIVGSFNILKICDYDPQDYSDHNSIAEKIFLKRNTNKLKVYWGTNVEKFKLNSNNLRFEKH